MRFLFGVFLSILAFMKEILEKFSVCGFFTLFCRKKIKHLKRKTSKKCSFLAFFCFFITPPPLYVSNN
jgi:hypothetical protein